MQRLLLLGVVVISVAACTGDDKEELSSWMLAQRNGIKPNVKPLSEPKKFEPTPYAATNLTEPFANERLASVLRGPQDQGVGGSALLEAEERRRKQPLESFPLDAIKMVGSLDRGGQRVALLRVNSLLYQIGVGMYIGQNYGRVTSISENEVVLREVAQDVSGDWVERSATLQLSEESAK